jgi:hypothetical protein
MESRRSEDRPMLSQQELSDRVEVEELAWEVGVP